MAGGRLAGPNSPKIGDYPKYMSQYQDENARGVHAIRVLDGRTDFTVDKLIAAWGAADDVH